jgi:hypothetical protein
VCGIFKLKISNKMKKKNCILYLVRTSKQDVDLLNRSLDLVYNNVLPYLKQEVDIILFHEKDFDESYKNMILKNNKIKIIFQEIIFEIPKYSKKILDQIPEFFPHPTHGPGKEYAHTLPTPHKGFTLGYRHMCRFFSGDLFNQQILNNYENYMRLDNDSFILSPIYYDIFEWFEADFKDLEHAYGNSGTCTAFMLRKILEKAVYLVFAKNQQAHLIQDSKTKYFLLRL